MLSVDIYISTIEGEILCTLKGFVMERHANSVSPNTALSYQTTWQSYELPPDIHTNLAPRSREVLDNRALFRCLDAHALNQIRGFWSAPLVVGEQV